MSFGSIDLNNVFQLQHEIHDLKGRYSKNQGVFEKLQECITHLTSTKGKTANFALANLRGRFQWDGILSCLHKFAQKTPMMEVFPPKNPGYANVYDLQRAFIIFIRDIFYKISTQSTSDYIQLFQGKRKFFTVLQTTCVS